MSQGFFTFSQTGLKCTHDKKKNCYKIQTKKFVCVYVSNLVSFLVSEFCGRPASGAGEYLSSFYCFFFLACVCVAGFGFLIMKILPADDA